MGQNQSKISMLECGVNLSGADKTTACRETQMVRQGPRNLKFEFQEKPIVFDGAITYNTVDITERIPWISEVPKVEQGGHK